MTYLSNRVNFGTVPERHIVCAANASSLRRSDRDKGYANEG